jgi:ribosomal-protein-alanine N-acetyltransferase
VASEKLSILPMQAGDIPAIVELETGVPSAWNRQDLEAEMQQQGGFQLVVRNEASGKIQAYLCGRIVADEAEILRLSVVWDARRQGLGLQLLDFSLRYCRSRGAKKCFLELRASNIAAGKLYEKRGFTRVGRRRAYYRDPVEDAVLLQLEL